LAVALLGNFLATPENRYFPEAEEEALMKARDPSRRLALAQERLGGQEGRRVSLRETIEWSLDALSEDPSLHLATRTRAVAAFYDLGAFAPQPQQFDLASVQAVTGADTEPIGLLLSRNLLERRAGNALALHQTLADVARSKTSEQAVTRHRNYYLALVRRDPKDWRIIEPIYGQVRWAWENAPEDETWFEIPDVLGDYLSLRGLWNEIVLWESRGLRIAQDRNLHLAEGNCLARIGMAKIWQGNLEEALTDLRASLAPGRYEGERDAAHRIFNVGRVLELTGNGSEALKHYEQVREIGERTGNVALIAGSLNNIGRQLADRGDYDEALRYFSEGLVRAHGVDVRRVRLFLVHNIGRTYLERGDLQEGLRYLHAALEMQEHTGDAYMRGAILHHLAIADLQQGDRITALQHFEEALGIRRQLGDRLGQRDTLVQLAKMAEAEGRLEVARDHVTQALELQEKVGVGDSSDLRQWQARLGGAREASDTVPSI
jgi:tetratricopeptide (TPR) repeat protein